MVPIFTKDLKMNRKKVEKILILLIEEIKGIRISKTSNISIHLEYDVIRQLESNFYLYAFSNFANIMSNITIIGKDVEILPKGVL
jgi:hypothetical protein